MTPEPSLLADRWIRAWTSSRGLDVSTDDGWPLVHVGSTSRETELICIEPGIDAFAALLSHVDGKPRAMLTVLAADLGPYASIQLPPGIRVDRDDETLMQATLTQSSLPPLDSMFSSRWDTAGAHQTTLAIETGGRVAASGIAGILGTDVTFDAIETTPGFQRRGLGRYVMTSLTAHAVESGADTGILAATAKGRLLYEALGWQPVLQMWSLMGTAD